MFSPSSSSLLLLFLGFTFIIIFAGFVVLFRFHQKSLSGKWRGRGQGGVAAKQYDASNRILITLLELEAAWRNEGGRRQTEKGRDLLKVS